MKRLLLSAIVCVLAMFGTLKAQNSEVLIDGTIGAYTEYMDKRVPFSAGDPYSISQQYYTAEEIGVESGYIESVSFKTDMNWYADDARRLEIYMVNTENSSFNGLTMEQVKNEDLVFSGNVKFEANAWTTIEFNKKNFNYTGGNVLLCVNDLTGQLESLDCYFTTFFVPVENGVSRSVCHRNEAMYFDPTASAIKANEQLATVPFVKFAFTEENTVEEMTTSTFNVYPNPVSDRLYVETQTLTQTVEIYDVYGRLQDYKSTSLQGNVAVDVKGLNSGVYFVKVVTENGEMVKRFIKK